LGLPHETDARHRTFNSNGGISAKYYKVVVIDMPGPFDPSADAPAVKLVVKRRR